MIPATEERVPRHTAPQYNERIRRRTEANVTRFAVAGAGAIERRLAELDREWDIERTLEANAATVALLGLAAGTFVGIGGSLSCQRWWRVSCCSMPCRAGVRPCRSFAASVCARPARLPRSAMR